MDSGKINKKYNLEVLKLLKIWENYYLDASSVYYALKKAHTKADGGVEYDICTYHARLKEAAAVHLPGGQDFDLDSEEQQMCIMKGEMI